MENINEKEKRVLDFWQKNEIFEKSLKKESTKDYVFYDGPPFATGMPHYGHLTGSILKDAVPRFWTMRGFRVERKWGWDCHGLPIENIIEKELEFKSKKDIENFGIVRFNNACRMKVLEYAEEWKKIIRRLGRWVDMENSYKTMDLSFMESVWWVFQKLWEKGLIYEGYRSMHICPRCETTLSQQEVSEGYKDVEDLSVVVKLKLSEDSVFKLGLAGEEIFILAWTTTPWTLPANVALAVGEKISYVLAETDSGEKIILAESRLSIVAPQAKIIKKIKGIELVGLRYWPLFSFYESIDIPNKENIYSIVSADFVVLDEGTGIVHIAPAFGEDDMRLGQEKSLPFIQNVGLNGHFSDDVGNFSGLSVKPTDDFLKTDKKITEDLKNRKLLFKEEFYRHSYPHCWRCETPLINYAASSWFVRVVEIKKRLIELAEGINWFPAHLKEGRFGKWLENAKDWCINRQRFWATAMPVWRCDSCSEIKVFGSIKELEDSSGKKISDLHKDFVDAIDFNCAKCSGKMKRIPDVLDCWFDSGSMPFAQNHYPFENQEKFDNNFPAQFIGEGVDQTRAWFYYLHVIAGAIKDSPAFKNVIVNGTVLAPDGKKMSKRLKNYPESSEIMEKYGADALRFYILSSTVLAAEDFNFSEIGVREVYQKSVLLLENILNFYLPYKIDYPKSFSGKNPLDVWLVSKLSELRDETTTMMEVYDLPRAVRPIFGFINDFSTWWLRLSRPRFKDEKEMIEARNTFGFVLEELAKIMAPFAPFVSERIYQEVNGEKESVHLENWPDKIFKDSETLKKMEATKKAVEIGMALRAQSGIKVRQPLSKMFLKDKTMISDIYPELVCQELNIKDVVFGDADVLDLNITEELKMEGLLREFTRTVNQARKESGFSAGDKNVRLEINNLSSDFRKALFDSVEEIKTNCSCSEITENSRIQESDEGVFVFDSDSEKSFFILSKI